MVDPLSYFSIQPVLHNWGNKGHEDPMIWRQWVSSITIGVVLYHMSNVLNHKYNVFVHVIPFFLGKSVRSWCNGSSDRSFMVDPLSYFSFQPVFHNWCNKGCGMCFPVCGMMHIKEPLLLIGKSIPCGSSGFPLSLFQWFFTICLTPYIHK